MQSESVGCQGDAAVSAEEKMQQAMAHAAQAGSYVAAALYESASDTIGQLEAKADEWAQSTGSKMREMGASLGSDRSASGVFDTVSNTVAESLEQGGAYLETAKISGTREDLARLIRRHPIASLAIAVGVGWLVGRSTRK